MRVLFVSASSLKRETSIGNTFLNLFEDVPDIERASICTKRETPDLQISECFCITEKMLIKNLLKKTPTGMVLTEDLVESPKKSEVRHKKLLDFAKRHRWTVFFWLQDLLWSMGNWKTQQLRQFVDEFKPDVIFTVLSSSKWLNDLILHVSSLSDAKLVLYAWDNNYTMRRVMLSPFWWLNHFINRASMRKVVQRADLLYVISDVQKKDYENCFHRACKVLTKGADFSEPSELKKQCDRPMQIVFTGNIALNRWKSLKMIAAALENINQDDIRMQLRIYTATPLSKNMGKALNRGESSFIMGSVPATEVPEIQRNADMLVHVEAFDLKNRMLVRQSFSTKIVDYLKEARPILAVGPKDVASIDHLVRNDCAIVADNQAELERKLCSILEDPSELNRVARNAYECGRKHHNKKDIQQMLMQDLRNICGK